MVFVSISFLYLSLFSFTDYTNITQDHKNYSILGNKKEDSNPALFFIWAAVDISLRSPSTWLRLSLKSPADSLLIRLKAPHLAHSFRTKMWFSSYCNKIKRIVTNVTILFIWAAVDSNHRPHPYQGCALTTWASSPHLAVLLQFSLPHEQMYYKHFLKSSLLFKFSEF